MKIEELRKAAQQIKKHGGVGELMRQLDLNVTLEDRRNELQTGVEARRTSQAALEANMQKRLNDDRVAQERHEQHLARMRQEHEQFVKAKAAERAKVTWENDQFRKENADLKQENLNLTTENRLSKWIIGLARHDKAAIDTLHEYMKDKELQIEPPSSMTNFMFEQLMQLARDALTRMGLLVPTSELDKLKVELAVARKQSFMDRLIVKLLLEACVALVRDPTNMTTDQRRLMLWVYTQIANHVRVSPLEVIRIIETSETCPVHNLPMRFDYTRRKWFCIVLNCSVRR